MKVSILMLTHNAPYYVWKTLSTLRKTAKVEYELIVVDNASSSLTKKVVKHFYDSGDIDKVYFSPENTMFAKGNNLASQMAADDSDFYLLLNSDINIRNPNWLKNLLELHPAEGGISSYGAVESDPQRADGFCMLINRELYDKYQLDEKYAFWWSVTKLEAQILKDGKKIIAVKDFENQIYHYGGKSGKVKKNVSGMDTPIEEVLTWFAIGGGWRSNIA